MVSSDNIKHYHYGKIITTNRWLCSDIYWPFSIILRSTHLCHRVFGHCACWFDPSQRAAVWRHPCGRDAVWRAEIGKCLYRHWRRSHSPLSAEINGETRWVWDNLRSSPFKFNNLKICVCGQFCGSARNLHWGRKITPIQRHSMNPTTKTNKVYLRCGELNQGPLFLIQFIQPSLHSTWARKFKKQGEWKWKAESGGRGFSWEDRLTSGAVSGRTTMSDASRKSLVMSSS